MLTQAGERLLCATPLITDPKRVSVAAEPISHHQTHSSIISTDLELDLDFHGRLELETAPSSSSQPHPKHLLAAAPESRPSDSSTPACNRSGRNVRRGVYGEPNLHAGCRDTGRRREGGSEPRALTAAPQLRHTMN